MTTSNFYCKCKDSKCPHPHCDKHNHPDCMECFYTTKTEETHKDWRERFDEKFHVNDEVVAHAFSWDVVKDFIQEEREALLREVGKEVEKKIEEYKDIRVTYDQDIDITELPEGLLTEMKGMKKGLGIGLNEALKLINSKIKGYEI